MKDWKILGCNTLILAVFFLFLVDLFFVALVRYPLGVTTRLLFCRYAEVVRFRLLTEEDDEVAIISKWHVSRSKARWDFAMV